MDETENQVAPTSPETSENIARPTYTSQFSPKKKSPIWILMAIALLVIAGGIFFLVKKGTGSQKASPSPEVFSYSATSEPVATVESTSTPKPVDKEGIKIQILNGTGIARGASFLQGKLRSLGYTQIEVGNAETEDYSTTEVYFASNVADEVVAEIKGELESIYESVKTKTGSTGNYDIKIVTGLQKGATPKPTATKSPAPTSTSTPKPTVTASPTPTP